MASSVFLLGFIYNVMDSTYFQYYKNDIHTPTAEGWVSLRHFLKANKTPKPEIVEIFNKISEASAKGDSITKARLKESLFSFTPCVHVSGRRRYSDIIQFTGLAVLDFDKIENAIEFKEYIFNEYNFIYSAWLSPSKKGVKAMVKIPICQSTDEFKAYFFGISAEMDQYNGFDGSGQNCVLPLFLSYDPELLQRENPETWSIKGFKRDNFESAEYIAPTPIDRTDDHGKIIIAMIDKAIDKIDGNGHPQLRGICISIGGYIANNYINRDDAVSRIFYRIEQNSYLSKGVPGYKKTALWALSIGLNKPLHLDLK